MWDELRLNNLALYYTFVEFSPSVIFLCESPFLSFSVYWISVVSVCLYWYEISLIFLSLRYLFSSGSFLLSYPLLSSFLFQFLSISVYFLHQITSKATRQVGIEIKWSGLGLLLQVDRVNTCTIYASLFFFSVYTFFSSPLFHFWFHYSPFLFFSFSIM